MPYTLEKYMICYEDILCPKKPQNLKAHIARESPLSLENNNNPRAEVFGIFATHTNIWKALVCLGAFYITRTQAVQL